MMYTRRTVSLLGALAGLLASRTCVQGFCSPRISSRRSTLQATEDEAEPRSFFMAKKGVTKEVPNPTTTPTTAPSSTKGGEIMKSDTQWEILGAIWDVAGDMARQIFFAMRRTAATALTASLPEHERDELLERTLGKDRVAQARSSSLRDKTTDVMDDGYASSMSVQESVAAAVVKESNRDPVTWAHEKDAIYRQAQTAANDRVATELAIQKQRMEKETMQLRQQQAAAQQQFVAEKKALERLQADLVQQNQALAVQQQTEQQKLTAAVQEQQIKLATMEQALREKEQQAEEDRAKMIDLAQALELASSGASSFLETSTTIAQEEKPRLHAGRYTPEEYRALTDEEKEQVMALREQGGGSPAARTTPTENEEPVHPILGPVLEDLGYKRIHVLSAGKLGTIPIWKKQRIYRHERAKAMVEDKWKSMSLGLPGVICLHEGKDGKLSIIDGQHRVGMMMLLRDRQRKRDPEDSTTTTTKAIDLDRVLVEVYPHLEGYRDGDDDKHAQDLFLEINKAEPLKLIDMPGVAKAQDRKLLNTVVEKLYEMYPAMFSPSQRCRAPNVNVDNLRDQLFGADVIKRHNLTTSQKMAEWILAQNQLLADKYEGSEELKEAITPKAWAKASDNKFYLGLESSWLYN